MNWNILVTRGKESKSDFCSSSERNESNLNHEIKVVGEQCKHCAAKHSCLFTLVEYIVITTTYGQIGTKDAPNIKLLRI